MNDDDFWGNTNPIYVLIDTANNEEMIVIPVKIETIKPNDAPDIFTGLHSRTITMA